VVLSDPEDVESDLVGELDLFQKVAESLRRGDGLVGQLREGVDAKLDRRTVDTRPMPASADSVRLALLALHKAVLAAEREQLERVQGRLSSSAFLQIVSDPLRYGWLKPFSELILAFEEDEEDRAPVEELLDRTRELLLPPQQKTPFGRRYLSLMQREPALVLAHSELARLLR
jgi:hypothetical protein